MTDMTPKFRVQTVDNENPIGRRIMPNTQSLDNLILQPISLDLSRSQTPTRWCEELNFRADSGYDLDTLYRRALSVLERAFHKGQRVDNALGFNLQDLPPFHPQNRLRVTIEVLAPGEHPCSKSIEVLPPA